MRPYSTLLRPRRLCEIGHPSDIRKERDEDDEVAGVQRGAAPLGRRVGVPADLDEAQHEQFHFDRQGRAPQQVVELVEVPDVELEHIH